MSEKNAKAVLFNEIAKNPAHPDKLTGQEIVAFRELLYWHNERDFFSYENEEHATAFLNKLIKSGPVGEALLTKLLAQNGSLFSSEDYCQAFHGWMVQLNKTQRASVLIGQDDLENGIPLPMDDDRYDTTQLIKWINEFSTHERAALLSKSYNCRFLMDDLGQVGQVIAWMEDMTTDQRIAIVLTDDVIGHLCKLGKTEYAMKYLGELSEDQKFMAMQIGSNLAYLCKERPDVVADWIEGLDSEEKTTILSSGFTAEGLVDNGLAQSFIKWMDELDNDQRTIVLKGEYQSEAMEHMCESEENMTDDLVGWLDNLDSEQRAAILFDGSNSIHVLFYLSEQGKQGHVKKWIDELPGNTREAAINRLAEATWFNADFLREGNRTSLFASIGQRPT